MEVTFHIRWWWPIYLHTLVLMCELLDREPNWERVGYWIDKAIVLDIEQRPGRGRPGR